MKLGEHVNLEMAIQLILGEFKLIDSYPSIKDKLCKEDHGQRRFRGWIFVPTYSVNSLLLFPQLLSDSIDLLQILEVAFVPHDSARIAPGFELLDGPHCILLVAGQGDYSSSIVLEQVGGDSQT